MSFNQEKSFIEALEAACRQQSSSFMVFELHSFECSFSSLSRLQLRSSFLKLEHHKSLALSLEQLEKRARQPACSLLWEKFFDEAFPKGEW